MLTLKMRRNPITGWWEFPGTTSRPNPGLSVVSGDKLLPPTHKMFHWQFSHILPKGHYGRIRLLKKNIVPCTVEEHQDWEQIRDRERLLKKQPKWAPYIKLEEELKLAYNTGKL